MATFRSSVAALLAILAGAGLVGAACADTLTVTKTGSGSGIVSSNVGVINCGTTCSDNTLTTGTPITLTATPAGGSQFTGWLGPCTGAGTCQFTLNGPTTVSATFASTAIGAPRLDIDGVSSCDALTDGLLVIRYLFGLSGAALINGAVGPGAARTTDTQIGDYLTDVRPVLDIDGNGQAEAFTDGLLILRYLFGLRGAGLVAGAVGPGAIRPTAPAIETQIQNLCLTAIYVSTFGNDSALGTQQQPKRTVNAGIATAAGVGAATVYVAVGNYPETNGAQLRTNVSVRGGYDSQTWQPAASGITMISGGPQAILASNVTGASLWDLSLQGNADLASGRSVYGARLLNSTVAFHRVNVSAAAGSAGTPGASASQTQAAGGGSGGLGQPGAEDSSGFACASASQPQGGTGGSSPVGASGGRGGNAGHASNFGFTGQPGAGIGAGAGGPGTPPGAGDWNTPSTYWGLNGATGGIGTGGGAAGQAAFTATGYSPTDGSNGQAGANGRGGGGGGGGGGGTVNCDSFGGGGGGGGGGGQGGQPGAGGTSAGASIAVYLWQSTLTTSGATTITATAGQPGGSGGQGQPGGPGGLGGARCLGCGAGNLYGGGSEQDDGSNGGRGGDGGGGGAGGGGAGGAGGASIGVCKASGSSATLDPSTVISIGPGGVGGASPSSPGPTGIAAQVYTAP